MRFNTKRGISLIVLVITIIVMIILAAAIILSLSNSGIIGKANKAKTDSDNANLKEYVNTLRAEWELMTESERTASGSATFEDYANKKLEENGYKQRLSEDGTLMKEAVAAAIKAGIQVGDGVTGYTLNVSTYTTSGEENTCDPDNNTETNPQPNTVTTNTDITWKYLGVNTNGEMEIMADLSTTTAVAENTKVTLGGKGGYLKGPGMLNIICEKLYSKDGVGTARSMNIDDVNNILGYTGEKGVYYDNDYTYISTKEALTIGEVESKLGIHLDKRNTPDGKELALYKLDGYCIYRESDLDEISIPGNMNLIYNKNSYWLASPCVYALFADKYVNFCVRCVSSPSVYANDLFDSKANSNGITETVRPVVTLNSNVRLTPNADKTEWTINQ